MAVGSIVFADTTLRVDEDNTYIQECGRGLIQSCDPADGCNIAFLNKDKECLTYVTLSWPDTRILLPILHAYENESGGDFSLSSSSLVCDGVA